MNKLEEFGTLIYEAVGGSHSYGTNQGTDRMGKRLPGVAADQKVSDLDIRGIFIPRREYLLGFNRVDEFIDKSKDDAVYFSLQKFLSLALECNPNVVEQLFVKDEHVLFMNEYGKELRDMRSLFLSKNAYGRFGSYAFSQMKRLTNKSNNNGRGKMNSHSDLIEEHGWDTKHGMHLVRLFNMGIQILKEYKLDTFRPERLMLFRIRNGLHPVEERKMTLEEMKEYGAALNSQLEEAMVLSAIPDYPDFDRVNAWAVGATDRCHNLRTTKGVFKGTSFNILPLDYEMVDKSTILLVSNRLVRKKNKSEAFGVCVPYKDWYTGLREFSEFKFADTSIDSLRKFIRRATGCDPKAIDVLFAGPKHAIYAHPFSDELKKKLSTLFTTKTAYATAIGYVKGNIDKMKNWERLKREWESQKQQRPDENMTVYPPVPRNTESENSSYMTKFGYDTLTAYDIVHVLKLFIELMNTGSVADSRAHETELYAIKHGHYKTFEDFLQYANGLQAQLEEAKINSKLKTFNHKEIEEWAINFVDRFHEQLE